MVNIINGTPGNDTLSDSTGDDSISGLGGADSITAGEGADTILGGDGNDTINDPSYWWPANTVYGGDGDDWVYAGGYLDGGIGNDTLNAPSVSSTLIGGEGNDSLYAGAIWNSSASGGAGDDTLIGGAYDDATLSGGDGADYLNGSGDVSGDAGNDTIIGYNASTLKGGDGDDVITSSAAHWSRIDAGTGNDLIHARGLAMIDGGSGNDTVSFNHARANYNLLHDGADYLALSVWDDLYTLRGVENIRFDDGTFAIDPTTMGSLINGTTGHDSLTGTAYGDRIDGKEGDDTLNGGGGNDTLFSGTGNDTITGGDGFDIVTVTNRSHRVMSTVVDLGGSDGIAVIMREGRDIDSMDPAVRSYTTVVKTVEKLTIRSWWSGDEVVVDLTQIGSVFNGTAAGETLGGTVWDDSIVAGSGNDTVSGGDGNDILLGEGGDDSLMGGLGNDSVDGGAGNDTLSGDNYDILRGGDGDDVIQGGTYQNVIDGGTGNDLLSSGGSYDLVAGGDGNDTISGTGYYGSYVGGSGDDVVSLTDAYSWTVSGGSGNDTLDLHGIAAGIYYDDRYANYSVENVIGTAYADTIYGSVTAASTLQGGAGDDRLYGGALNDSLIGGDGADTLDGDNGNDTFRGGAGNDKLTGSDGFDKAVFTNWSWSYRLGVDANENLTVADVAGTDGTDTLSGVESLTFEDRTLTRQDLTDGNDTATGLWLSGGWGDDSLGAADFFTTAILEGGSGNDTLRGSYSNGTDLLIGGWGDDSIELYGADQALGGFGTDTFAMSVSYTPATMTGGEGQDLYKFAGASGDINGAFVNGEKVITDFTAGNGGDVLDISNLLTYLRGYNGDGLAAASSIRLVQDGADVVLQADTDADGAYRSLEPVIRLKNVSLSSLTAHNLGGYDPMGAPAAPDTRTGSAINDTLVGGLGNDTFLGGDGNDSLVGGDGRDSLAGEAGSDTLIGGLGADTLNGGIGDDQLYDSYGLNVFDGGDGDDYIGAYGTAVTVTGGDGNDTIDAFGDIGNLVDAGVGDDVVQFDTRAGNLTLGAGKDIAALRFYFATGTAPVINDFATGQGGDTFHVANPGIYLSNYSGGDPFASGHYVWTQDGTDAVLVVDYDGAGSDAGTLLPVARLKNVNVADLTWFNVSSFGATAGNDNLIGVSWGDEIDGLGGNDWLRGLGGNDTLRGGEGVDTIEGGNGDDLIRDYYAIAAGDIIDGGAGNDTLAGFGDLDDATLLGVEHLQVAAGGTTLTATVAQLNAFSTIRYTSEYGGTSGSSTLVIADGGALNLTGRAQAGMLIYGSAAGNAITMTDFSDTVHGGAGNDTLNGMGGDDTLGGGEGHNSLSGGGGADQLFTGLGDDTLDGGAGNDWLGASSGDNSLTGGAGNDTLIANEGDDYFDGGDGDDSIESGAGSDTILGGSGNDTAVYYGTRADYTVIKSGLTTVVTGLVGSDTLTGVEFLKFDDQTVAINTAPVLTGDFTASVAVAGTYVLTAADIGFTDAEGDSATFSISNLRNGGIYIDGAAASIFTSAQLAAGLVSFRHSGIGLSAGFVVTASDGALTSAPQTFAITVDDNAPKNITGFNPGDIELISRNAAGVQGNGGTGAYWMTEDGRYVLFDSNATNMVGDGQSDGQYHHFRKDMLTGEVVRIDAAADGTLANQTGWIVDMSTDGNVVLFASNATNLGVPDVTSTQIFAKNLTTGTVSLVSTLTDGTAAPFGTYGGGLTGDGQKAYYTTWSLDGGAWREKIYVKSLSDGAVSVAAEFSGPGGMFYSASFRDVSADGGKLLFVSDAPGLVPGDSNNYADLFVLNTVTGAISLVTATPAGDATGFWVTNAMLSRDGSKVIFAASLGSSQQVFVKNMTTGTLIPISSSADGSLGNAFSEIGGLSPDGRTAYFWSAASNLVSGDTNDKSDLFAYNLTTNSLTRIVAGNGDSYWPSAAGNNRVLFASDASNLVAGDTNGALDTFLIHVTGNDSLIGSNANDTLRGQGGNDTLDGGLGNDKLYGGAGNDVYYVDQAGDQVFENANEGTDTIVTAVSLKAGANIERLVLSGTANNSAYGNASANTLTGNIGNNTLVGYEGNDTLNGGGGNDKLDGGIDQDALFGDAGNDNLLGGEGSDTLDGGTGNDQLNGGARWDTLRGGEGDDILDGGLDNDQMYGGAGNDTYVVDHVGDRVNELLDEGTDTVKSSIDFTLSAHLEVLYLTGPGNTSGTGNGLANSMNGSSANNTLSGGLGNDSLFGWDGNDSLVGGNDHDRLSGGNGNDTLVGGQGNDVVGGGAGADDFVFSATAINGHDHVSDFQHGLDRLVFTAADYGFAAGHVLTAAEFTNGTAAVGTGAQFIWNDATDRLYFDADGNGAGEAYELAIVTGNSVTKDDLFFT